MPLATIFGASSNHGRSIIAALLADQWEVRAIVTSKSGKIHEPNVTIIHMPCPDDPTIRQSLLGVQMCYVTRISNFEDPDCFQNELKEGKMIADACKDLQVPHIIYNTQLSPRDALGLSARHCDVKAQVEEYMNTLRLPLTCLELPFLYENLYTLFKPEMIGRGVYRLAIPMGKGSMDCISYTDVGPVVLHLALNRNNYIHKTLALAGDKITVKELSEILGHLTGWNIQDRQMTVYEYKQLGWPGCVDIANYFDFITRVDQRFNIFVTRQLHPEVQTFKEWVNNNKIPVMENVFDYLMY